MSYPRFSFDALNPPKIEFEWKQSFFNVPNGIEARKAWLRTIGAERAAILVASNWG